MFLLSREMKDSDIYLWKGIYMISKEILKEESILLPIEYDTESCEKAICNRMNQFANL